MLMKWEKAHNKKYPNKSSDIATCGTRSGVRTLDTVIKSQVLYQLS